MCSRTWRAFAENTARALGQAQRVPPSWRVTLRIAILGVDQPWIGAFCRKVMEHNFVLGQDINQPEQMVPIVAELGLSALGLIERAQSEPIKTRLRVQTEQARAKGIFGAPTFFVGTEMFWGNDRLDDALLFAAEQKV
jgi:2-hydroxychromene-2-carboxylate isomerase